MREKRIHLSWHRAGVCRKVRNHTWKLWKCPRWALVAVDGLFPNLVKFWDAKILGCKAWLALCVTRSSVTCTMLPHPGTVGFCRNLVDFLPISRIWAQLGCRSWDVFRAAIPVLGIDPHPGNLQGMWSFLPGILSPYNSQEGLWVPNLPGNVSGFPTTILQVCLSLSYPDVRQQLPRNSSGQLDPEE